MSATMLCAHQAGIKVFVTGGIGGVHRGGEDSEEYYNTVHTSLMYYTAMDVSADLSELGRTPVAVVCAGVKSILDIGRTLEVLVCTVCGVVYCTVCVVLYTVLCVVLYTVLYVVLYTVLCV